MWPELEEAPPRPPEHLLEGVLRRGHELRRTARRRRQIGWLARAAGTVAIAGLVASAAHGPAGNDGGRTTRAEVAAPSPEPSAPDEPSTTTGAVDGPRRAPATTSTAPGVAGSEAAARRHAPLAIVEERGVTGGYRTVALHRDGTVVPVTAATASPQLPVLAPQGDLVAFQAQVSHPVTGRSLWEVFTVRVDGTDLRQVTGGIIDGGPRVVDTPFGAGSRWPSWSPDGRRLAFSCPGPTGLPVICLSQADGSARRRITVEGQGYYQPIWSPDGRTIAAKREVDGGQVELWLLSAEGGAATPLPTAPVDPRGVRPSWSVDGRQLVYASDGDGGPQLVIVDVATGDRRIVPTPGPPRFPVVCGEDQVLYLQSDVAPDDQRLRTGPLVLIGTDGSAATTILPGRPDVEHLPSSCATR